MFDNAISIFFSTNEITWKILIDGFLKQCEFDACLELLHMTEEKGCESSVQTYFVLIKEILEKDKPLESKELSNKITEKGYFILEEALLCLF